MVTLRHRSANSRRRANHRTFPVGSKLMVITRAYSTIAKGTKHFFVWGKLATI
jgi:hypothetical protein